MKRSLVILGAAAAAFAAYALAAVVVAPVLVERAAERYVERVPGRSARVESVRVNPLTLGIELGDVVVSDPGAFAFSVARVEADLDAATLLERRLVLGAVSLEAPRLDVEPGRSAAVLGRLARMVLDQAPRIDRLDVAAGELRLGGARADFRLEARALDPRASAAGRYTIEAADPDGATLKLEGELASGFASTAGSFALTDLAVAGLGSWLDAAAGAGASLAAGVPIAETARSGVVQRPPSDDAEPPGRDSGADDGAVRTESEASGVERPSDGGPAPSAGSTAGGPEALFRSLAAMAPRGRLELTGRYAVSGLPGTPEVEIAAARGTLTELELAPGRGLGVRAPSVGIEARGRAGYGEGKAALELAVDVASGRLDLVDTRMSPPAQFALSDVAATITAASGDSTGAVVTLEAQLAGGGTVAFAAEVEPGAAGPRALELAVTQASAATLAPYAAAALGAEPTGGRLDLGLDVARREAGFEGTLRVGATGLPLDGGWQRRGRASNAEPEPAAPEAAVPRGGRASAGSASEAAGETFGAADGASTPAGAESAANGASPGVSALAPASTDLELALALLADRSGQWEVTVGIDARSAETLGAAASRALTDRIAALAAAPFDELARLVARDPALLEAVPFGPGTADLSDGALERVGDLAAALAVRPGLGLRLAGAFDPRADRDALAMRQIELHVLLATAGPTAEARPVPIDFESPRAQDILDEFAGERLSDAARASLKGRFDFDRDGEVEPAWRAVYYRAVATALAANETIADAALARLGRFRALAIANALTERGIAAERIEPGRGAATGVPDGGEILLPVQVAARRLL